MVRQSVCRRTFFRLSKRFGSSEAAINVFGQLLLVLNHQILRFEGMVFRAFFENPSTKAKRYYGGL